MTISATIQTNAETAASVTRSIRDYVVQSLDHTFRAVRIGVPTLWTADTIATALFVSAGGIHLEANPIIRWVIENTGIAGFIFVKLLVLVFWLTLANRIRWQVHAALSGILFTVACMGISLLTTL